MKKYLAFLSISAMLLTTACSTAAGVDGEDGTTGGDATTTTADGTTAADGGETDAGVTKTGYKSIVIYDKYKKPDCQATSGPGPDIDMVAVWRNNKLIGVGKPGTCNYSPGSNPACLKDNKHAATDDIAAACGPFGDLDFKKVSTGYLSLGGGSLELSIGACSTPTDDFEQCDGTGAVVEIFEGDEIDVYEVDQWYLGKTAANTKVYITLKDCACLSEEYEVSLRPTTGNDTGSLEVGTKKGTGTLVVPAAK